MNKEIEEPLTVILGALEALGVDEKIDQIKDVFAHRLPVWATFLISGLFGLATALIALLVKK